jgi:hypothetical protein
MISHALFHLSRRSSPPRAKARRRILTLEGLERREVLSGIWVGGGINNNWSTAANWSDGLVPNYLTNVVLDATDDVVLDVNTNINSLTIQDSASLVLNAGNTLSTRTGGFTQSGGTLTGTAAGSVLSVAGNFTHTSGAFDVDNVTLSGQTTGTITSGLTFDNLTIAYGSHHLIVAAGKPLDVNGTLTITGYNTITGDIYAAGDVNTSVPALSNISSGKLILDGAGAQTLNGNGGGGALPAVFVQKAAASTLTLTGSITPENWTQVSGKLAAAGSTTTFIRSATGGAVDTKTTSLGNVVVNTGGMHFRINQMNVGGDLTIQSATNFLKGPGAPVSSVVTVAGNLTSNDATVTGTADIVMNGTANATITAISGDFPDGGITINKGSAQTVTANVTQPLDSLLTLTSMGALKGTFQVGRNVVTTDTGFSGNNDGSPVLVFKGTSAQTLTAGVANASVPGLEFDKTGGSFTLVNNANVTGSNALGVNGGWIVDATNIAPVNVTGTNVKFVGGGSNGSVTIDTGNSAGFANVELANGSGSTLTIPKMIVNGLLSITNIGTITGTIDARANVTTSDAGVSSGPGTILFNGTGDQTLTAAPTGGQVPGVTINKTAGTLSPGTDRIGVTGDWTYTKGAVSTAGSTIAFQGYGSRTVDSGTSPAMSFHNVEIFKGSADTLTITNKLTVNNDLTITSIGTLNAALGAITVARNLTSTDTGVGGSTNITMITPTNATILGGDFPNGGIIISKGSSSIVTANVTQPLDGPLTLNNMSALLGTFQVGRDVLANDTGISGNDDGSPVLVFKGTSAQTLTAGVANASVPGLEFNKTGGSFTLANNANVSGANALKVTGGWIVDATNTAPVTVTGTNLTFQLGGGFGSRTIDTGNSAGLNNVNINAGSGANLNGADIDVKGNVTTQASSSLGGNSRIHFIGATNQTLAATADNRELPGVIIDKTGGVLTIDPTYAIAVRGHWTYIGSDGSDVVAAGSTIKFVGATKLIRSGAMVFGNVNFAVGSADHVEVLDAGMNPGTLYYSGTATNTAKVTKGTLVDTNP